MTKAMRLKSDKRLRDRLYTAESYQHPAKGHLGMWQAIIEKYTHPGETILDPMGGVGASLVAALMGRNVICVELEPHFVEPMKASWEKMKMHPMLGYALGEVLILRGDARCLPLNGADGLITSPPYPGAWGAEDSTYGATQERERRHRERHPEYPRPPIPGAYTRPSAIISSPPYEASVSDNKEGPNQTSVPGGWKDGVVDRHGGYTRPSAIITSPPYEGIETSAKQPGTEAERKLWDIGGRRSAKGTMGYTRPVDAVVSSPPYEGMHAPNDEQRTLASRGEPFGRGLPQNAHSYADMGKVAKIDAVVSSPPYQMENPGLESGSHPSTREYNHDIRYSERQTENIGNLRGGDLYALLVYNRLRREPNQSVEVHLCGKCLPVEIVESLSAEDILGALDADENQWPRKLGSESTIGHPTSALTAEQKLTAGLTGVGPVPQFRSVDVATMNGQVGVANGEDLLGIGSDKRCVNETTTPVRDVALRTALLSIISKVQKKLGENGIIASETWLQSVALVTTENMQLFGCILCNASLVANPSGLGTPMPSAVLRLRFVTPNIVPLSVLVGEQKGNYWLSMLQVYEECFRILKSQGIMALVLKGFTRDGQYIDLPRQTSDLVESLGFTHFDEWQRELWSLSFWRILQGTDKEETVIAHRQGLFDLDIQEVKTMKRVNNGKLDDRLRFETVLAFRKDDPESNGIEERAGASLLATLEEIIR